MKRSITERRDLRTGTSLWADSWGSAIPTRRLRRDCEADVAVVGSGISGALMAYCIAVAGRSVVVLDRREPLHGSTVASTALLQAEIDTPLSVLCDKIGTSRAQRAWRASLRGVRDLGALIERDRIRCGYSRSRSLYLAGDLYGPRVLAAEVRSRERAGIPATFLDQRTLWARYAIDRAGAIESDTAAVANPLQLAAGVLRRAVHGGAVVYSPVTVADASSTARTVRLYLEDGYVVHSRAAVFCTGYERPRALPTASQSVKSTWAVATRPVHDLPTWLRHTVVWEASDPYLYLRSTPGGRLVAGGEDDDSPLRHTDVGVLATKAAAIARKVAALLPTVPFSVSHAWAGAFGETDTGLPVIEELPGLRRCYSVTGFGGNGITYSMIAAQLVTAVLLGRRPDNRGLFRSP